MFIDDNAAYDYMKNPNMKWKIINKYIRRVYRIKEYIILDYIERIVIFHKSGP